MRRDAEGRIGAATTKTATYDAFKIRRFLSTAGDARGKDPIGTGVSIFSSCMSSKAILPICACSLARFPKMEWFSLPEIFPSVGAASEAMIDLHVTLHDKKQRQIFVRHDTEGRTVAATEQRERLLTTVTKSDARRPMHVERIPPVPVRPAFHRPRRQNPPLLSARSRWLALPWCCLVGWSTSPFVSSGFFYSFSFEICAGN